MRTQPAGPGLREPAAELPGSGKIYRVNRDGRRALEDLLSRVGTGLDDVYPGDLHDDCRFRHERGLERFDPHDIIGKDLATRVNGHRALDLEATLLSPEGEGDFRVLLHVCKRLTEILVRDEHRLVVQDLERPDRDSIRGAVFCCRGKV